MRAFIRIIPAIILTSCDPTEMTSDAGSGYGIADAFPNLSFTHPTDLQNAGDGKNRLFVVEQAGRILVFPDSTSAHTAALFIDIPDRVSQAGGEEGLLGLAFHPDFPNNGYFYLNYVAPNPRRTVISRFEVSPGNPDSADKYSEFVLLEFDQPFSNHNGGQIRFGPDLFLYIATGDGGSGGDPMNNGQSLTTFLGKILRIDVDMPSAGRNYSIPVDNPFIGGGFTEEIYAYGLRNPWRFSFDRLTGWLWTGDVGQDSREEVDVIEKGKNYGWRVTEGTLCYDPPIGCDTVGLTMPVWEYGHDLGESVTGGFVYGGAAIPELIGAYIFGDYTSGRIWSLRYDGTTPASTELLTDTNLNISSFGIDEEEELFVCDYNGKIFTLVAPQTLNKSLE